jgi:hypothetical protein
VQGPPLADITYWRVHDVLPLAADRKLL